MKRHDFLSVVAGSVAASALSPAMIWAEGQGKWKLVSYYNESHQFKVGKGEWTGKWEFYDLEADRTEMHNLAGKHPEKVTELKILFENWSEKVRVVPWETLESINAKLQKREQVY